MNLEFNQDLVDDVARRRLVLFLGSGVSASANTRSGEKIKNWEGFLRHTANTIPEEEAKSLALALIERNELLLACEVIKRKSDPSRWSDILYDEFAKIGEPSALHRAIMSLKQRIVITTNFDKLVENAWVNLEANATRFPSVVTRLDSDVFRLLRDDRSYIIKLHGSIDDENSIIFTKTDYLERAYGNWAYSTFMHMMLLTHTFLFIGFSMNDPAVSYLIESYAQKYPHLRPHYTFQPTPIHPELIDISKRLRKLYIIPYDPSNDHEQLPLHIRALAQSADSRRREMLAQSQVSIVADEE